MTSTSSNGADRSHFPEWFDAICSNIGSVLVGKREVIELAVIVALARGHLLIDDVPGVGKTTLASALARTLDVPTSRIQFTPDLLPSDVVGTSLWNQSSGDFTFRPGPIFTSVLLADEINRASPKTQSALLESMAERQVTVDGQTRPLPNPFMVIATQNPIEHHGTYPLPDSQLDRFMMSVSIGYPPRDAEARVLETDGADRLLSAMSPVIDSEQFAMLATHCDRIHVSRELQGYLLDLAEATRTHGGLRLGMSTRAVVALQRASRVRAAAEGRDHVTPDDVRRILPAVVAHRLVPAVDHYGAADETHGILESIVSSVPLVSTA